MKTLYLRFPDRAAFEATLPENFQWHENGDHGWPLPDGVEAIHVAGTLHVGGQWDEAGELVTPPTPLAGFHVNVLGELPQEWRPYQVFPSAPQGVFG